MPKWQVLCRQVNGDRKATFTVDGEDEDKAREMARAIIGEQYWEIINIQHKESES